MTQDEALRELRAYRDYSERRDEIVAAALAAGVTRYRIVQESGLSKPTVIKIARERDMSTTITPELVRSLREAEFGSGCEAVIARDEKGELRVEPDATAKDLGHEIIEGATAVEEWSDGQPMTAADYETYAREMQQELMERDA